MILKHIRIFVLTIILFLGIQVDSSIFAFQPDYPEIVIDESLKNKDITIVSAAISLSNHRFVYVLNKDQVLWKSPRLGIYWSMEIDKIVKDFDGDGFEDFLIVYGQPHYLCGNFGALLSTTNGKENYLVHYHSTGDKKILETTVKLPISIEKIIKEVIIEESCDNNRNEIENLFKKGSHLIIGKDDEDYKQLRDLHRKSLKLYKEKKILEATTLLYDYFQLHDFRIEDHSQKYPFIKNIINDYAFLLSESKLYNEAITVLVYVVTKYPSRIVAYINLGDSYYGNSEVGKAKQAYQKYIDLMKKEGKEKKIPKRIYDRLK